MNSLFVALSIRGFWLRGLCIFGLLTPRLFGVVQLASGTAVEDVDTAVVRVPLYLYTDQTISAGQFDVSVPDGWQVLDVDSEAVEGVFSVDADALETGGVRVVVFSHAASEIPVGSLGTVVMEPPSVGDIVSLDFSNPLFVGNGETTASITPGFPELQIVSQPLSQTILAGQDTSLSVSVLAIDPTYIWFQGLTGDISNPVGVSSALFETPELTATTTYWVRVTDTFGETVDSAGATITVDTGPTYIFSPSSREVGWEAGSESVALQTPINNAWTATSSEAWLSVDTASGTGPGDIAFSFESNRGLAPRSAQISIGGVTFTLNQSGRPGLFADYPLVDGGPWRHVPWFGLVTDNYYPWVYHESHGWLFIVRRETGEGFYAYSQESDLGWLYIAPSFYNTSVRWVYSFRYESFLYFHPIESLNPASRYFYHAKDERWFLFPED